MVGWFIVNDCDCRNIMAGLGMNRPFTIVMLGEILDVSEKLID
jgi:hypothetical protein